MRNPLLLLWLVVLIEFFSGRSEFWRRRAAAELEAARVDIQQAVGTPACVTVEDCRSMPAGAKVCGGPQFHVVFAPATVDVHALAARVDSYTELERSYNRRFSQASNCMVEMPPTLDCHQGLCSRSSGGRPR